MAGCIPHRARSVAGRVALAVFVCLAAALPARAQHRARLSADLADHLAHGSQDINVIVEGSRSEVDALAARYNLQVRRYITAGGVLNVNAGQLAALQQDPSVDHLSGDIPIRLASDVAAESIGVDQVWTGQNDLPRLTGAGIGVAVIDSGIDQRHDALRGRVIATYDFTGGDGVDRVGHGTHVAAIIAGAAGATPDTADYRGIASGASLVNLRVLGNDGSGTVSSVVEAIDWAIAHRLELNIRVINLSLGTPVLQPYRDDPMCEAVERAVRSGIVVVVAAGNEGQLAGGGAVAGGIMSPGNCPEAIAVGAIDTHGTADRSDDTLAAYSSRGPTRYDLVLKPDLAAPGTVVSAESEGSYFSTNYPARHVAGRGPGAYMTMTGTSMAAAVVSGAATLLVEGDPGLAPTTAKFALQLSASFVATAGLVGAGAGSLNVPAAVTLVSRHQLIPELIDHVAATPSGIAFALPADPALAAVRQGGVVWDSAQLFSSAIVWDATIVWSSAIAQASDSARETAQSSGQPIAWDPASVRSHAGLWDGAVWGSAVVEGSSTSSSTISWDPLFADP